VSPIRFRDAVASGVILFGANEPRESQLPVITPLDHPWAQCSIDVLECFSEIGEEFVRPLRIASGLSATTTT
jgi:hypothetical protein